MALISISIARATDPVIQGVTGNASVRQLAEEVKTIRASLKAGYENALSQENEMRARIDELQQEVLALQKKQVRYNILKREVDTNRKLYQDLLQRFKEVDIAGGVGANVRLRERLRELMNASGGRVCYPRPAFCTDNGAMIAYAGYRRLQAGQHESLSIKAMPRWSLEELSAVDGEL